MKPCIVCGAFLVALLAMGVLVVLQVLGCINDTDLDDEAERIDLF